MIYEKPEVVVLGSAANTIHSNKPHVSETALNDPAPIGDTELAD
jgi:hypothetical protein